jgi:hypothetical protein
VRYRDVFLIYRLIIFTNKKCIPPAKPILFNIDEDAMALKDAQKFHTIIEKLLYLGKHGRLDILLTMQFLCTRVKSPTK